jgi:Ca-activated chloride channel family protein
MNLLLRAAFFKGLNPPAAFALSCTLLASLSPVIGQPGGSASREVYRSNEVILVHSDLVLIPVTVTDRNGRTVPGLEKEHFTLFENSARQDIIHFTSEDAPASIGIVFDASGSMRSKMTKAREAVNNLLNGANPDDEFFFVRFSTEARLTVPMTHRVEDIRDQLSSLRTNGTTALLDGVRMAITEMEHARHSRKAIVIISDGEDNASLWTVPELKKAVREHEIVIYSIGLPALPGEGTDCIPGRRCGTALLKEISTQTGGRLFVVRQMEELPGVTATIGEWLRHQYVLGYVPNRPEKDGTYRKVEVRLERPKGYPKMTAAWRQGYYAPRE